MYYNGTTLLKPKNHDYGLIYRRNIVAEANDKKTLLTNPVILAGGFWAIVDRNGKDIHREDPDIQTEEDSFNL